MEITANIEAPSQEASNGLALNASLEDLNSAFLQPALDRIRDAAVITVASGASAASKAGFTEVGVKATNLLLGLNQTDFIKAVVLKMCDDEKHAELGQINLKAVEMGASDAITQLSTALLCGGHVDEAADLTLAFWEAASSHGMSAATCAQSLAPAIIAGVECGRVDAVAQVQIRLAAHNLEALVVQLTVQVADGLKRPDVAAAATWEAMKQDPELSIKLAALIIVEGYHKVTANVVGHVYHLSGEKKKVAELTAEAIKEAVHADKPMGVVETTRLLLLLGEEELVVDTMECLVVGIHRKRGGGKGSDINRKEAGQLAVTALKNKQFGLIKDLTSVLIRWKRFDIIAGTLRAVIEESYNWYFVGKEVKNE